MPPVKLSLAPTIVPIGEPGFWSRPHIRAIYTFGLYNQGAVEQRMSSYLQTVGATSTAHFFGTRAEWWFTDGRRAPDSPSHLAPPAAPGIGRG